jgi:hypothetical protein
MVCQKPIRFRTTLIVESLKVETAFKPLFTFTLELRLRDEHSTFIAVI